MKKLIVFDLDGTLAESKSAVDSEMVLLLLELLNTKKVAIISGGSWQQFENQLLANLPITGDFRNLSLLPTCGTAYYRFDVSWTKLYSEDFTIAEKKKILLVFKDVLQKTDKGLGKIWGERIEDRGSQITFSGLGQLAPLSEKIKWDPDFKKRKKIKDWLEFELAEFAVNMGGTTSIDITKKGIDKAYGIQKLSQNLGIELDEILFVGDALFDGGNDYSVKNMGVDCVETNGILMTKVIIKTLILSFKI